MPAVRNAGKPNSRAHRRPAESGRAALVRLPADGCDLPVPDLPAGRKWSTHEKARWQELWESPQATQWDETCKGTVALLVTYEGMLLKGEGTAWVAQECRYASEALGLTPRALGQLGWAIASE